MPAPPSAQVAQSLGILRRKPVPSPLPLLGPFKSHSFRRPDPGAVDARRPNQELEMGRGGVEAEKTSKVEFQLFLGSIPLGRSLKAADFLSENLARLFISPKWKACEGCGTSVPRDGRTPRASDKVKRGN